MKLIALFLLYLSSQANGNDVSPSSRKLVCYAELWAGTRTAPGRYNLNNVPSNTCDYLILIYLTLDADDWTLKMYTGYTKVDPEDLRKAGNLRIKSPSMKVLLSVGGWEDGASKYSQMMSVPSRRKAFVDSVIQILETYDLDGLELHWLYPGLAYRGGRGADKDNFVKLVKELKTEFKPRKWILTASVPPDEENVRNGYNVPRLNRLLDQIHVRTIDMRGDWTGYTTSHCPLYSSPWEKPELLNLNVNGSLSLWESEGADPGKLLPTFPFYGRSFTLNDSEVFEPGSLISGPGQQTFYIKAPGLIAYFEICDRLKSKQLTRYYQNLAESPYAVQNKFWVGYEDEISLKKKVQLLTEKENRGAAVFALGLDDFEGACGQPHILLHKMRELLDESPFYTNDSKEQDDSKGKDDSKEKDDSKGKDDSKEKDDTKEKELIFSTEWNIKAELKITE